MKHLCLLALLLGLVSSCLKSADNDHRIVVDPPMGLFTGIGLGNLYGNGREGIAAGKLVIENDSEWRDLLAKMNAVHEISRTSLDTAVDFTEYRVVAVFDSIRPSDGYGIAVTEAVPYHDSLFVTTRTYMLPSQSVTAVITQPFYIARIPQSSMPIRFIEH